MHRFPALAQRPSYTLGRTAGTLAIRPIAEAVTPDRMQIVSFHPRVVFTKPRADAGATEDMFPFDSDMFNSRFSDFDPGGLNSYTNQRTWAPPSLFGLSPRRPNSYMAVLSGRPGMSRSSPRGRRARPSTRIRTSLESVLSA